MYAAEAGIERAERERELSYFVDSRAICRPPRKTGDGAGKAGAEENEERVLGGGNGGESGCSVSLGVED